MKTELKAKLIQHLLSKKNGTKGFTLIELLVVIIIIGILAAIALPAFLNQANRARQSEAQTYVGSINRSQQAYRLEEPHFSTKISGLGLGIKVSTEFYGYGDSAGTTDDTEPYGGTAPASADPALAARINSHGDGAGIFAIPTDNVLLSYGGSTYTLLDIGGNATTTAVLCTANNPGGVAPDLVVMTPANLNGAAASITSTNAECN